MLPDFKGRLINFKRTTLFINYAWATLRIALRDSAQRMPINDSWIAATALALGVAVVTQDDDYVEVPGLTVIKV